MTASMDIKLYGVSYIWTGQGSIQDVLNVHFDCGTMIAILLPSKRNSVERVILTILI